MSERKSHDPEDKAADGATESTEPQVPYVSPIAEPQAEETTEQVAEPLEIPSGHVGVVYRGTANVVRIKGVELRPGQPVAVPSEVAEELLTMPHETFERVKE